jgi:hypothetical protein
MLKKLSHWAIQKCLPLLRKLNLFSTPIEDVDYQLGFFSHLQGTNIMIELLTGPYKGTVYSYNWIRVTEEAALGVAKLSFHYTIIHNTKYQEDPKFQHYAGDILKSILSNKDSRIGNLSQQHNGSQSTEISSSVVRS